MYSITGCSRWLSPIRILATGSLSATGNRDNSRIWLVHTQLINHYRSSNSLQKNGTNISIYPKITKTTKRPPSVANYPAPRPRPWNSNWNLSDSALWQSAPGNPSICAAPITTVTVARQVPPRSTLSTLPPLGLQEVTHWRPKVRGVTFGHFTCQRF